MGDYRSIISVEASGALIKRQPGDPLKRLTNVRDEQRRTLVMGKCLSHRVLELDHLTSFLSSFHNRQKSRLYTGDGTELSPSACKSYYISQTQNTEKPSGCLVVIKAPEILYSQFLSVYIMRIGDPRAEV